MPGRFTLLFLFVVPLSAGAQGVPDTTAAWRYFPLAVGDVWQYQVDVYQHWYCTPCIHLEVREIVDSVTTDGTLYFAVRHRSVEVTPTIPPVPPLPPETTHLVRFDTAGATAVRRDPPQPDQPVDYGGCRLDEAFPAPGDTSRVITCPNDPGSPWDPSSVRGGYDLPLPLGGSATQKAFRYPFVFGHQYAAYAAGIGLIELGGFFEIDSGEFRTLRYANVGGVEYGTPIVYAEPGTSAPPAASVLVRPNPVHGSGSVTVTLARAALATVVMYDVLGRVVTVLHNGPVHAGSQALPLDVTALPTGIYIVRLSAPGIASSSFVVSR